MSRVCDLTKEVLETAYEEVRSFPYCVRTPLLQDIGKLGILKRQENVKVHLKLENMQTTGSFKVRGLLVLMKQLCKESGKKNGAVAISCGNFGKAFAYLCQKMGIDNCTVVMPNDGSLCNEIAIKQLGCQVVRTKKSQVVKVVNQIVEKERKTLFHALDDINVVVGNASCGIEILEEIIPDVVVTCCGGGGLAAAIGATMTLYGHHKTRVYGVEPETANTMQKSLEQGKALSTPNASSIAASLSPPFISQTNFEICKAFEVNIVTVTDRELALATRRLFEHGIIAEVSGAASFAAIMFNKIPNLQGDVVAIVTGGNTSPQELASLFKLNENN